MRTKIMSAHGLALLGALACNDVVDAPSAYEAKLDSIQQYAWITELSTEDAVALLDQAAARNVACDDASALGGISRGEGAKIRERAALLCAVLRSGALPEAERVLRMGLRPAYAFTLLDASETLRVGPFERRSTCEALEARLQSAGMHTTACDAWQ